VALDDPVSNLLFELISVLTRVRHLLDEVESSVTSALDRSYAKGVADSLGAIRAPTWPAGSATQDGPD
jgi:hypothetical protein